MCTFNAASGWGCTSLDLTGVDTPYMMCHSPAVSHANQYAVPTVVVPRATRATSSAQWQYTVFEILWDSSTVTAHVMDYKGIVHSMHAHPFLADHIYILYSSSWVLYDYVTHNTIFTVCVPAASSLSCLQVTAHNSVTVGGSSSAADFVSTNTLPYTPNQRNAVFMVMPVQGPLPCLPPLPSAPDSLQVTSLYPGRNASASGAVSSGAAAFTVQWPSFTFAWEQSIFGYSCADALACPQRYVFRAWPEADPRSTRVIVRESKDTSVEVELGFSYSRWCWSVAAFNGLNTSSHTSSGRCFDIVLDLHPFPSDCVELPLVWNVSVTGQPWSFSNAFPYAQTGSYFMRVLGPEYSTFTLFFTLDHLLLTPGDDMWLTFSIRTNRYSFDGWEAGRFIAQICDVFANCRQWDMVDGSYLPLLDQWWPVGIPLNRTRSKPGDVWNVTNIGSALLNVYRITNVTVFLRGYSVRNATGKFVFFDVDTMTVSSNYSFVPSAGGTGEGKGANVKVVVTAVVVSVAAFLVVSAVFVVLLGLLIHSRRKLQKQAAEGAQTVIALKTITLSETFDEPDSTLTELIGFPLTCSESSFNFGFTSHLAPIGEPVTHLFTLTNNTTETWTFKIFPPTTIKFELAFMPGIECLAPEEQIEIEARLEIFCTTTISVMVPLAICAGKDWSKASQHTLLPINVSSMPSQRVDPDEVQVFRPPIGEGAFGAVFRGTWRGQEVAAKVMKNQEVMDKKTVQDFKHEVQILETLRNPYVVNFLGACHFPGSFMILTEFMPLGNLRSCITKNAFSNTLKVKCALDCSKGLCFIHNSGIIHRDMKPDNLLMASLDPLSPVCCKITDFGTTRDINANDATQYYTKGVGTLSYQAPEILSSGKYSQSADVYSFAIVVYFLLTTEEPYAAENFETPWKIAEFVTGGKRLPMPETSMPAEVGELVQRCWAQEPHDRPGLQLKCFVPPTPTNLHTRHG
eukprot:TRINITY_DN11839_c1_g1_i1.p1 TRINITY_DN11839_c1_g1~~TRINITY_DN11839_c1_g1_i1.p1  ORF type:complete len:966 (-),score=186.81 TRINITY_DN11839_c1_g1_i1:155-3052(-)